MKSKFLQISIGISLMLFASGFFMYSIQSAKAEMPAPESFIAQNVSTIGKYQMALAIVPEPDGLSSTRVIVWNTQTGKSTYYRNGGKGWEKHSAQLPASPNGD